MSGKWLELLKEVAPHVERVGFMMHPETPAHIRFFKFAEAWPLRSRSSSWRSVCMTQTRSSGPDGVRCRGQWRLHCHSARCDVY